MIIILPFTEITLTGVDIALADLLPVREMVAKLFPSNAWKGELSRVLINELLKAEGMFT
jgi:hypothetical protein